MATPPQPVPRRPVRATDALKPFQLVGVRDTGEKVGDGSYATVKKLEFRGLKCVGKKIHALLYEMANQHDRREMLRRFISECELLSRLHHPCIVQFLGVYFEEGSQLPVMVMEYLYATLAECLDKYGVLPEEITYGILRDVALGLRYLHEHSPSIIHRDLSANNVLLATDISAKISDLGVAKILNLSPSQITQRISTQAPGTPCYMPPEALVSKPSYTSKIDSYSYGVLMIHILCGKWPFPGDAFIEAPNSPGSFLPVSEFDRRREHILKIGLDHPLMGLIQQCLSNAPASRPEAVEILGRIEDLKASLPPSSSFENKLEMIQQIQPRGEDTDGQQTPNQHSPNNTADECQLRQIVESLRDENITQRNQIETLRRQNDTCQREVESKTREVQDLRRQNESQGRQIRVQWGEIESSMREVRYLRKHREAKTREVASQNQEILSLREQLEKLSISLPSPSTIEPPPRFTISPDTPVKWRRCADLPIAMSQHKPVFLRGMVYVGGGYTITGDDRGSRPEEYVVLQYDPRRDVWVILPPCPVRQFALGQFQGHLIVVGGCTHQNVPSNKVYRYREESRKWEEYLKPMPTARFCLSVIATPSAIIACGGEIDFKRCTPTVEAYVTETGQWLILESFPNPCTNMTSVIIDDTCYLLGGSIKSTSNKHVFLAQVSSLIESAFPPSDMYATSSEKSTWTTIRDTPKLYSAAASIGRRLLTVGGGGTFGIRDSAAINMFIPAQNAWVRMPLGDLPAKVMAPAAIELPGNRILMCGGWSDFGASKETFIGSFTE